jgi:hypothetical protein
LILRRLLILNASRNILRNFTRLRTRLGDASLVEVRNLLSVAQSVGPLCLSRQAAAGRYWLILNTAV